MAFHIENGFGRRIKNRKDPGDEMACGVLLVVSDEASSTVTKKRDSFISYSLLSFLVSLLIYCFHLQVNNFTEV